MPNTPVVSPIKCGDLFWWCARFFFFALAAFILWSCSPFVHELNGDQLYGALFILVGIGAAILVHSLTTGRPPWLYSLASGRLTAWSILVVIAWFGFHYVFIWWWFVAPA